MRNSPGCEPQRELTVGYWLKAERQSLSQTTDVTTAFITGNGLLCSKRNFAMNL